MAMSRTTSRLGGQLLGLDEIAKTEDLNFGEIQPSTTACLYLDWLQEEPEPFLVCLFNIVALHANRLDTYHLYFAVWKELSDLTAGGHSKSLRL